MDFFLYSISTWLILFLIGLPIAVIILPKGLREQSLVIALLFGYGYVTFISYYVFRSNVGGTDTYAWFLVAPPLLLLAVYASSLFTRTLNLVELFNKDALLALACTTVAWIALSWLHFDLGSPALALAISNLDVVELAVESRYLQEFPRDTQIGFMGQTGWLKYVGDVIWFGPSLIVAFISTLLNTEPYKLQTLVMNIISAQGAGILFLFARQLPGVNRSLALALALLYAVSPVIVYTAWQSFGAQMISIPIILAILYLHTYVINSAPDWSRSISTLASFVLLFSALLVTYHFMAGIVLALLGFHSTVLSILERSRRRFIHQSIFLIVLLAVVAAINPFRIAAIYELLSIISGSNNGWFIPWINPGAQLGLNAGNLFLGGSSHLYNYLFTYPLIIILFAFVVWHLTQRSEERLAHLAFFLGLFFPTFLAGLYFAVVGQQGDVLGSYRSFKITSTFSALTILVVALPLTNQFFQISMRRKFIVLCTVGLLCLFSIGSLWQILSRHRDDVYLLPQSVTELSRIEVMDQVSGLNILDMGNFTNLWANYFLLKKPHVFQQFPYGGRVVGPLDQPYTLIANLEKFEYKTPGKNIFRVKTLNIGGRKPVNETFTLLESSISGGFTLTAGTGWWGSEPTHQWSGREGRSVEVFLDVQAPVAIKLSGEYEELRPGDALEFLLDGIPMQVSASNTAFHSGILRVPPGRHVIKITAALDPSGPFPHDGRTLGILWRSMTAEQVESP